MDQAQLLSLLNDLIARWEGEVVEFKRAGDGFSLSDIGKYFSALSNEANLRNQANAWLVFGVDNNTRSAVGTDFRPEPDRLQGLKHQIAQGTQPSITLRNIHELHHAGGRVLLFEIPPAPRGMPIAWQGHFYSRAGESLVSLGMDKQDEIRQQMMALDWSAQPVVAAGPAVLDDAALLKARESFAKKHANRFAPDEVMGWPVETFLARCKLAKNGVLTRAAVLLLGKPESAHLLSPHPAQLTWKLEGAERAYEHFGLPFLLNTSALYQKIRNVQIRILPADQLIAVEVAKYDQRIVLEALHNCIAHQDYTRCGRIVVTELPHCLLLENEGSFYEGEPADYINGTRTPHRYRNTSLAQAMVELNMIDTMGYGIRTIHLEQARRYFPMPDYDLSQPDAVKLTIHGRVVDPAYSRLLIQKTDLPLEDILALDRVQKKLPLGDAVAKRLKREGLIEGRKPRFHVSAAIAKATARKADYIRMKGQDDTFYKQLVIDYLQKFGSASRKDIDELLLQKLSDGLSAAERETKVGLLLTSLRRAGQIENSGSRKAPSWVLADKVQDKSA